MLAEKTITVTEARAQLLSKALQHYNSLLDRIEETAENLDSCGIDSSFFDHKEEKQFKTDRLLIGLLRQKLVR